MRIGYARTGGSEESLDLQIDRLNSAGCKQIYEETTPGAAKERPERERCLDHLQEGDTLVVWRLDRFGRSLTDLASKLEYLEEKKVGFISLTEGIDTTTDQGKHTLNIVNKLASFEQNLAQERRTAGLKAAREQGNVGGRPPALDEEDISQIQDMMRNEDITTKEICEQFDISSATLYRYVDPDGNRRI